MWQVSSRSGVATLRTAIHLLLTYLLIRKTSQTMFQTDRLISLQSLWQTQNKIKNFQSSRSRGGYYRPTTLSYDVIHDVFVQFTFV